MGSGIRFRAFALLVAGLTISLVSSSGLPASGAAEMTVTVRPGLGKTVLSNHLRPLSILPTSGALFGAYTGKTVEDLEAEVGRKLTLQRVYYAWDDVFPYASDYESRDAGRTLILSWGAGTRDGTTIFFADIANGRYDVTIDARAAAIKAFGAPLIFVFNHEPWVDDPSGPPADFVRAYQHIHDRLRADGVTNVLYAVVLMSTQFDRGLADQFYPGDAYVDVIGADGYNYYGCGGVHQGSAWESFQQVFTSFNGYGVAKGKPMIVAEYGSGEDSKSALRKAQWFTGATATLKTWPMIKGVSYFNANTYVCDWVVDTSQNSLSSFSAMGADAYLNPPRPPVQPTNVSAYVSVIDYSFTPPAGTFYQGKSVEWLFGGPSKHTVSDDSGMGYFDSGSEVAGAAFNFTFVAAGIYNYQCNIHPSLMSSQVKVPMIVSPTTGHMTTTFTVTWASAPAPGGYLYDVQIQRPGSSAWSPWKTDQTVRKSTFTPDSGRGTYLFRSRLRKVSSGVATWYSDPFSISVS